MVKHNNIVPNVHLRKHWQRRVRVHLDQASKKKVRLGRRDAKSKACFPRPLQKLRPVVSSATRKYAGKVRYGRGFTLAEIKAAGLSAKFARTVGISVDHRRTSTSTRQSSSSSPERTARSRRVSSTTLPPTSASLPPPTTRPPERSCQEALLRVRTSSPLSPPT